MKHLFSLAVLLSLMLTLTAEAQMRGYPFAPRLRTLRLGVSGGVGVLGGDLTKESKHHHFRPIGFGEVAYNAHRNVAVGIYGGGGQMRSTQHSMESNTNFLEAGAFCELRAPLLRGSVFPLIQLRGGLLSINSTLRDGVLLAKPGPGTHFAYGAGAGVEIISWRQLGIRALFGVTYSSTDEWDLLVRGSDNDGYSWALLSIHYYLRFRR